MKVKLVKGSSPVLVSFPHSHLGLPSNLQKQFTDQGRAVPDADPQLPEFFDFVNAMGCSVIAANFSRYLMDVDAPRTIDILNPGPFDSATCPLSTLVGNEPIYEPGYEPDQFEVGRRIAYYWEPFHDDLKDELIRIKHDHGFAILVTIKPFLATTESEGLHIVLSTNAGPLCDAQLINEVSKATPLNSIWRWTTKTAANLGFLTTSVGNAQQGIHAWEIAFNPAADHHKEDLEETKAVFRQMIQSCLVWSPSDGRNIDELC